MKEIIEKAIEGGYEQGPIYQVKFRLNGDWDATFFMDSSFWQALGKACGWDWGYCKDEDSEYNNHCTKCIHRRFHEINLTEGFDKAVDYLKKLL